MMDAPRNPAAFFGRLVKVRHGRGFQPGKIVGGGPVKVAVRLTDVRSPRHVVRRKWSDVKLLREDMIFQDLSKGETGSWWKRFRQWLG